MSPEERITEEALRIDTDARSADLPEALRRNEIERLLLRAAMRNRAKGHATNPATLIAKGESL